MLLNFTELQEGIRDLPVKKHSPLQIGSRGAGLSLNLMAFEVWINKDALWIKKSVSPNFK